MANEAQLEKLNDAHQALLRAGDFATCADPRAWIRASNILYDACVDAGMDRDVAVHEAWAAERVAKWLSSGPILCAWCDDDATDGDKLCGSCRAEHRAEMAMMAD